ncbi:hypothetical protein HDU87_003692 [Geranomyces variabilis]|uniref:Uncharacterized protein n=1 Tax=Geranomyces variabilis TaxID=109894 RepID=A0AAD5TAK1_9FUNG|nr:hypothetical protein HDU87_003692 [Geranomyces variabilis]
MATFIPPVLPAGHWGLPAGFPAAPTPLNMAGIQVVHRSALSATARLIFLYDGIPDVDKVHEWGEAHAAHHNAIKRCDAAMGCGSFNFYDYLAYQIPPTLPNCMQAWMHDRLTKLINMAAAPLTNPTAPAGAANPAVPLITWFLNHFYASEFPKNLTAGYRFTISSLTLRDLLKDYI